MLNFGFGVQFPLKVFTYIGVSSCDVSNVVIVSALFSEVS